MKTDTFNCVPTAPESEAGVEGHDVAPLGIKHTVPVNCPCAGFTGNAKNVPSSRRNDDNIAIFLLENCIFCFRAPDGTDVRVKLCGYYSDCVENENHGASLGRARCRETARDRCS